MSWEMILLIALTWVAVGLGVASLFGRFARGAQEPELQRRRSAPSALRFWRQFTARPSRMSSSSIGDLAEATHSPLER